MRLKNKLKFHIINQLENFEFNIFPYPVLR